MIIDFHTHIFPEEICRNRDRYFENESAFSLLYRSPTSRLITADELLKSMDENKVDKSVVFGFPWNNDDTAKLQNDSIIEAMKASQDRLIGFCCVNPFSRDASREVERCLGQGMLGVGELAFYETGIDEVCLQVLEPIMEVCRSQDCPVLIHTNEPIGHEYSGKSPMTLQQIYKLVQRFENNRIVLAHWGGGIFFYNLLKKEVKEKLKNLYFDTAASPFLYDPEIYPLAIKLAGLDKIIFGSDYPLIDPDRYFKEIKAVGLSATEQDSIFGANATRLLNKSWE